MIPQEELEKLIKEGDSNTLELNNLISPEVEQTISAFANSLGGYILFGFKDDGTVVGLTIRQEKEFTKRLISLCEVMNVKFELYSSNYDMKVILVLRIYKNRYKYHIRTSEGRAYVRMGPSNEPVIAKEYSSDKVRGSQLKCFVAMSFREQEYPRLVDFYDAMQRAAKRCAYKLKVWKNDDKPFNGDAVLEIKQNIKKCDFMLADYTLNSSNVYYEEGYAAGLGREIIQTCENTTDLSFDINHNNTYSYSNAHQLEEQLVDSFNEICQRIISSKGN